MRPPGLTGASVMSQDGTAPQPSEAAAMSAGHSLDDRDQPLGEVVVVCRRYVHRIPPGLECIARVRCDE
jgi:hypothetical protein